MQHFQKDLIVKELYENSSELSRYAILLKKSDSPFADDKGWVWGYINANGKVAEHLIKVKHALVVTTNPIILIIC